MTSAQIAAGLVEKANELAANKKGYYLALSPTSPRVLIGAMGEEVSGKLEYFSLERSSIAIKLSRTYLILSGKWESTTLECFEVKLKEGGNFALTEKTDDLLGQFSTRTGKDGTTLY